MNIVFVLQAWDKSVQKQQQDICIVKCQCCLLDVELWLADCCHICINGIIIESVLQGFYLLVFSYVIYLKIKQTNKQQQQ